MAWDFFNGYSSDQTPSIYDVGRRQALAKQLLSNQLQPSQMDSPLSVIANALTSASSNYQNQQAADESQAGLNSSTQQLAAALANPTDPNAVAALATNPFAPAGVSGVGSALAGEMTPEGQLGLETGQANLGLIKAKIGSGFFGDDPESNEDRILLYGDPKSPAYAIAFQDRYGPKTTSTPGPEGLPIVTTTNPPVPSGIVPPTSLSSDQIAAPTSSATGVPGSTTPTPGGGSVTQIGDLVSRKQYDASRATAVAAPALATLKATMSAFLNPQNRIAVQAGEFGKFLATDQGKQALDSINAIANTVASAQHLDPLKVEEELTPLSSDSQAMLQFRLNRAQEYVDGLNAGNDTQAAQVRGAAADAVPSSVDAPAPVPLAPLPDTATAGLRLPGQQSAPITPGGWKILSVN